MKNTIKIAVIALIFINIFACTKEQLTLGDTEIPIAGSTQDRGRDLGYDCTPPALKHYTMLAEKKHIHPGFGNNWYAGALDELAKNCFTNEINGDICPNAISGLAEFSEIPEFNFANLFSNPPSVSSAEQINIVKKAIAHAKTHIEACEGKTVHINAIDFTIFPTGNGIWEHGYEVQFAVKFTCCDNATND